MSPRRFLFILLLLALALGGLAARSLLAQAPGGPAYVAPYQQYQQSPQDGALPSYPSTGYAPPTGAYPSTQYPSTASAVGPAPPPAVVPPYDTAISGLNAPNPRGAEPGLPPSLTGQPGAISTLYGGAADPSLATRSIDVNTYAERTLANNDCWTWQIMPAGLMYKPDMANQRDPRFASQIVHEDTKGWLWDVTLGGRVPILRYGTEGDFMPQGWQVDIEGAAFPRLDSGRNMVSTDFGFGIPLTTRQGPWEFRFGYNHLSSHLGDLFMLANPGYPRINYVRESLKTGLAFYASPALRLYVENDWAFHTDGGAEPWEGRVGIDYCDPEITDICGTPFFAVCGHLRQVNDYGGNVDVETGWAWRGRTGSVFRLGMQYFNGMSEQGQFYNKYEEQIGAGVWYDY